MLTTLFFSQINFFLIVNNLLIQSNDRQINNYLKISYLMLLFMFYDLYCQIKTKPN